MDRFLNTNLKLPYCKGCGHPLVLRALANALKEINVHPLKCAIITDIGCVGLADRYLKTHTVHTLHGRSTAIAAGIKMAENIEGEEIKVIVLIGDGGATIGLLHLVEAARMNIDINILLHNNFLYGMTGGQHSSLTPIGFKTRTTPHGNPFPSMDIISLLDSVKAPFLARVLAQDKNLKEIIKEAICFKGFSFIEIVEICTGYGSRFNKIDKRIVEQILEREGKKLGIIKKEDREYIFKKEIKEYKDLEISFVEEKYEANLKEDFSILIAGSAGEGVQFASEILAKSAISSGIYVTQKNDVPITVSSGFSVSELKFSKKEINYTGIEKPDFVLITSNDGFSRIKEKLKKWDTKIIADESIKEIHGEKRNFRKFQNIRSGINISAISFFLKINPFISFEIFFESLKKYGEEILDVAKKSYEDKF
jgi:pyruvate/2-oxoacid:ferredoxin oxidoreductase beta subunit/Pyruvate/2-oxoacid:ferredoxin oxidoreductase gamma subunit